MIEPVRKSQPKQGAQVPGRDWRPIGTAFAPFLDIRFTPARDEATWVLPSATFTGLDLADREALSDWLDNAGGIDTVVDFSVRPWNLADAKTILGVFEPDRSQATWLIMRHDAGWTLVRHETRFISDVLASLSDALGLLDEQRNV